MEVSDRIGDAVVFLRTPAVSERADYHEMNITQYSDGELDVIEQRRELDLHELNEDLPEDGSPMSPTTGSSLHTAFEVPDHEGIKKHSGWTQGSWPPDPPRSGPTRA